MKIQVQLIDFHVTFLKKLKKKIIFYYLVKAPRSLRQVFNITRFILSNCSTGIDTRIQLLWFFFSSRYIGMLLKKKQFLRLNENV